MASHGSCYRHLLPNGQQRYHLSTVTLGVLSLVYLSIQPVASIRPKACSLSSDQMTNGYCHCNRTSGIVNCFIKKFTTSRIPSGIPRQTRSFHLKNNSILRLEEDDFLGLDQLNLLNLSDNRIYYIHPNAFRNMYRLKQLLLDRNQLTYLDPSGRTFQHLSSLHLLSLKDNQIKKMNKYSFLTSLTSNLTVSMHGNSVECDCDVWALRSWQSSHSQFVFNIDQLTCGNGTSHYTNGLDSVSGKCNATNEVFSQPIKCPICHDAKSNYGCRLQGLKPCVWDTMVCNKTVEWSAHDRAMHISSNCTFYEPCLKEESNNKVSCSLNRENVRCNFCCRGSTCGTNYTEGRTKDFTFILSYVSSKAGLYSFMNDTRDSRFTREESRIGKGIQSSIKHLIGGMDVYASQFIGSDKHMQAVLRLEVTVFESTTKEIVQKNLTTDLQDSLRNKTSFLMGEHIVQESLSLIYKPEVPSMCPEDVSHSEENGNIYWKMSPVGSYLSTYPFYDYLDKDETIANRTCLQKEDGSLYWSDVVYLTSPINKSLANRTLGSVLDIPISRENAQDVSDLLRGYTKNLDNATLDNWNDIVDLLEQLTDEAMLEAPRVVTNVVSILSNLMNVDEQTLRELEQSSPISQRLLDIVDYISEKAPLAGGQLVEVTPNLVILAQEVNATMRQDVVINANAGSDGRFIFPMVSVGFINRNVSQPKGRSSLVIPMAAVVESLKSAGKTNALDNINRVSYAVYQSDKLFITAKHKKSMEASQANTAQNSDCKVNTSSNCHQQNSSLPVTKINSLVIAARVPGVEVKNLTTNITMRFLHTEAHAKNPRCVFWNKSLSNGQGDWSDDGCVFIESDSRETTCSCNHLTNFALLMDVYQGGKDVSELNKKILSIISYVGCGISLVTLILTLLTYMVFRNLRQDNPSKILINLCVALLLSNLIFLVGMQDYTFDNTASCKVIAVLVHYFLLASLTWMAVEAFYMYLALILVFKTYFTHFILKCCLIGWGVPLVVVAITLSIDATENYGFIASGLCWLRNPAFFAAFVGPVCLILLINCIAFGLVVRTLVRGSSHQLNRTVRNNTVQRLRGAVGVVVLLGLTWLFAIFAIDRANVVFYYIFAVLNSLQGLFIFIFYCLLKKDAVLSWKRSLPCLKEYGESSRSASNSRAVTTKAAADLLVSKQDSNSAADSSTFLTNTGSETRGL